MAFSCPVGTSGFICASCVCWSSGAPAGYVFLSALCLYLHPKMTEWHHWKAFLPFQTCLSINQESSEIKTHSSQPCTCVQPRVRWLLTNKTLAWTAIVTRNFPENALCWQRNTQLADGERLLVNTIWLLEIRLYLPESDGRGSELQKAALLICLIVRRWCHFQAQQRSHSLAKTHKHAHFFPSLIWRSRERSSQRQAFVHYLILESAAGVIYLRDSTFAVPLAQRHLK